MTSLSAKATLARVSNAIQDLGTAAGPLKTDWSQEGDFYRNYALGYRTVSVSHRVQDMYNKVPNHIIEVRFDIWSGREKEAEYRPSVGVLWTQQPLVHSTMPRTYLRNKMGSRKLVSLLPSTTTAAATEREDIKAEFQVLDDGEGLYDPRTGVQRRDIETAATTTNLTPAPCDTYLATDIRRVLSKLQGTQTPDTLRFFHSRIHQRPLMYRTRCWGFQTVTDTELGVLPDQFKLHVKHVWIDMERRTICVDWRSTAERPDSLWVNTGIDNTPYEDLTARYPVLPAERKPAELQQIVLVRVDPVVPVPTAATASASADASVPTPTPASIATPAPTPSSNASSSVSSVSDSAPAPAPLTPTLGPVAAATATPAPTPIVTAEPVPMALSDFLATPVERTAEAAASASPSASVEEEADEDEPMMEDTAVAEATAPVRFLSSMQAPNPLSHRHEVGGAPATWFHNQRKRTRHASPGAAPSAAPRRKKHIRVGVTSL